MVTKPLQLYKNDFSKPKNDWNIAKNAKGLNFVPGGFLRFPEKMKIVKKPLLNSC